MRWKGQRAALWDWPQRKWHTVSCPLAIGANSIASTRRIVWHWNNPWQADRFFTNAPNNGGIAWSFGTNPRIQYVVCATSSKLRCGIAAPFWSMLEQQIVSYNIWQWRGNQESSTGMLVLSARPNKNFYASSLTATTAPSHCFPDGLKEEHRKVVRLNLGLTIGGPRLVLTEKNVILQFSFNSSTISRQSDCEMTNLNWIWSQTKDKFNRTGMQLSAAMAHGWGCEVFIAYEQTSCGSSYTWEAVLHCINSCWKAAAEQGKTFPKSCLGWIWVTSFSLIFQIEHPK